nr:hypothetical protein [Tanacetum cinerariifolium]
MVPGEEDRVKGYIGGLPDNIQGNGIGCYECGRPGHFRKDCPKLRNQNRGNQTGNKTGGNEVTAKAYAIGGGVLRIKKGWKVTQGITETRQENKTGGNEVTAKAYAISEGGTNPDSNVFTSTFLLNNCYASMLFDSGADRSFMSTTFSALLDVAPSTLDTSYAIELADGRVITTAKVEKLKSFHGDVKESKVERDVEEIETLNLELDHKVDVVPLVPKLRKNRIAHIDYIRHTQEEAATLRELVESERLLSPLNTSLAYALQTDEPNHSGTTIVEVLKELPKVSMRDIVSSSESAPTFAELFEINELKAQIQEKDIVILKLKEKLKSFSGDVKGRKVEREVEEIETQNLELDHKVTKLVAENEHLKQTYKQLFDSIKSSRVQSKEHSLKEQLKGKAVLTEAVSLNPIDPALLQVEDVPLVPKLRKNMTAHIDYIRHTQEEAATLRGLVESERLLSPLNTSLAYALPPREPIPIVKSMDKPVVTLVYTRKPKAKNVPNKMEPNKSWGSSSNVSTSITDCRLSKSSFGIWTPVAPSI